jgi:hypothetical protein
MGFDEEFQQLDSYLQSTRLNVLVWGSGKSNAEHFEKREKIRQSLKAEFIKSSIHFSEDGELLDQLKKIVPSIEKLSVPDQELWHLAACDICVALDTSEGVGQEIAHFVNSRWCYKLLILTNNKYSGSTSFPANLRKNKNQIFYDESEYKSCNLIQHVIARVKQVALGKMSGMVA